MNKAIRTYLVVCADFPEGVLMNKYEYMKWLLDCSHEDFETHARVEVSEEMATDLFEVLYSSNSDDESA
jgi:hypothetical protein